MTDTTQPEVVAWMRGHLSTLGTQVRTEPHVARVETVRAYRKAHPDETLRVGLRALVDAYDEAARKPLAVADVPDGQGPASLHITSSGGRLALWFKADDGTLHFIRWAAGPGDTPPARALWDHLTATITHVTTKEP